MSHNDPTLKNKVSPHIDSQLPEFIKSDHALFSLFLKYYYEFLEAGELVVSGSNNYLIEETLTKNYILDEQSDNIVLEDSVGKFVAGETVTGATSKATAKILVDDFDNNNRLFISSQQRFQTGETITGQTSGATSTVVSYRANPVQNIQQLLAYADVDNTVYDFLDNFRDSFMEALPSTLASGLSKRKLIKSIKDMYSAKGTRDGHKLFFRILFNEEAVLTYPRDNLLRPSDGQWSTDSIIRVVENSPSNFTNAIGQRITGATSGATALIATVIKFREGATVIAELNVDTNSVTGTFVAGETVTTIDTTLDLEISATIRSIVTGGTVTFGGAYHSTSDPVFVFGGGGNGAARARVSSAGAGSIDEIMIESGGSGYSVGESLVFDLTNTEGTGVTAKIAVVGGAFVLEQDTAPDHLISEAGDLLVTDDDILYLQQEETVGDLDHLVLEDGGQIVIEQETFNDLGVSAEIGEITKITMIDKGNGFVKLPLVSDSATTTGSGASLFAASTQSPMVGHAEGVAITNFGLDYTSLPNYVFNRNLLVKNVVGSFVAGDTLTSHTGTVVDFDSNRNILEIRSSITFAPGDTITSITGATCTIYQADYATATSTIGVVGSTDGNFVTDRGKVSVDTMKIQDSYYYQDYSYVVRISQSINEWRESIRRSVHPAGWNVFGQVSFASLVSATIQAPTAGSVPDFTSDTTTFTPELASTFENLFTTIFGRRLGTVDDGTSLVSTPMVGYSNYADVPNPDKREVTLSRVVNVRMNLNRFAQVQNRLGPTLNLLPQYAFAVHPTTTSEYIPNYPDPASRTATASNNFSRDQYTVGQWGYVRIDEVCIPDGSGGYKIPDAAWNTKVNIMPPSEIYITRGGEINAFDNTFVTFDDGVQTFDEEGTPRALSGSIWTSYDEVTGVTFDETGVTLDEGA